MAEESLSGLEYCNMVAHDGSIADGSHSGTSIVQVSNIAPQATRDQMVTLFSFVGRVDDCRLYPSVRDAGISITSRCAFVKFADPKSVGVTLHLNNTVFIDRAVIITPVANNVLPDENEGLIMAMQVQQQQSAMANGSGMKNSSTDAQLLAANPGLVTPSATPGQICTPDVALDDAGLPPYPLLPCTLPVSTVEEIRRTIQVAGLDSTVSAQQCMDFLNESAGEVKFFRFCTRAGDPIKYALAEFTDRSAVVNALKLNGQTLGGNPLRVTHSSDAIQKPVAKSNEAAQREIEEAMSKVKEANCLVSAAVDPLIGMLGGVTPSAALSAAVGAFGAGTIGAGASLSTRTTRSRSRELSRRRSRSPHSRHGRRRSRSRSRDRRRSRSRDRHRRHRSRSRSRDRHRRRHRSRSKSKDRRKRSKSRDRKRDRGSKDKEETPNEKNENGDPAAGNGSVVANTEDDKVKRSRSKSPSRRRSRSPKHSRRRSRSRSKDRRRRRSRDRKRSRSRDRKRRSRSRDRKRSRSRDRKRRDNSHSPKRDSKVKPRDYDQEEAGFENKEHKKPPSPPPLPAPASAVVKEEHADEIKREPDDMEISNSP